MITTNDVVDGVSIAIYNKFGSGYKIYPESISQGLNLPCFIIYVGETMRSKVLHNRYKILIPFRIRFIGSDDGYKKEFNSVGDKLFECLEVVELLDQSSIRGSEMKFSYDQDGNMVFDVIYKFYDYVDDGNVDNEMRTVETEVTRGD